MSLHMKSTLPYQVKVAENFNLVRLRVGPRPEHMILIVGPTTTDYLGDRPLRASTSILRGTGPSNYKARRALIKAIAIL